MRDDFHALPDSLPVPKDDGACSHLEATPLPDLELRTTSGALVNLARLTRKPTVLFFYPRTGRPDEAAPVGWDEIPGARGCTPQSCGYRDHHSEFTALGIQVFGVSTQTTEFQQELARRLRLPYEILSDSGLALTGALKLPTFTFSSMTLLKRAAWFCQAGKIVKVFYPVFPPDENAETVLRWLRANHRPEQQSMKLGSQS
ncbi:MAG: peroxiredoxin [Deltaproteobacteria bacterium]|nr:peroxiredoxin [Deltaproteobacteria bacterium]